MPRFPQPNFQRGDQPTEVSLDGAFVGIDGRRESDIGDAAVGRVLEGWNTRFEDGHCETRRGCCAPVHFNPIFERLFGSGVFSDPAGTEYLLAVDASVSWLLADCYTPRMLPLPTGTRISGKLGLLQAFIQMLMFRGKQESLIWSGKPEEPWKLASSAASADIERPRYLSPLPNAEWGILVGDRVFVPVSRDEIAWSDILEPNRFDLTLNRARFNRGEDDSLVGACSYQGNRIVIFKDKSIWYMNQVYGDMSEISIDRLPGKIGCIARESIQEIGGDILWLAQDGVYSLGQTEEGNLRGATIPISAPVDHLIRRINWAHAHKASATFADQKYKLAVPMDASETNNVILVLDLLSGAWHSADVYAAPPLAAEIITPRELDEISIFGQHGLGISLTSEANAPLAPAPSAQLVATYLFGAQTAFIVDTNRILALGHGDVDRMDASSETQIGTRVRTRGYTLQNFRIKALRSLAVVHSTKDAEISLAVQTEGVEENISIQKNRRRDRLRYRITGKRPFVLTDGERFTEPHREDYAWMASDNVVMPAKGIPLDLMQTFDQGHVVRRIGRSFSVTISSSRGRLRLHGVQAEGLTMGNTPNSRS